MTRMLEQIMLLPSAFTYDILLYFYFYFPGVTTCGGIGRNK